MTTPAEKISKPAPEIPFEPYIPASVRLPELTVRALVLGTILGMVFGASSLYLVLKVGLTVSASIPVAVISLTVFRAWSKIGGWFGARDATILENNIVQTAGSAGESLAFGLGATMPAILILGFDLEVGRAILVAVLGGFLGILMMIPLRRALIVQQHGMLKYPEGTACAEVLKAGASIESKAAASPSAKAAGAAAQLSARAIFSGFGLGLIYKTAMVALKGWKDVPEKVFGGVMKAGSISAEISPELLGVGYIIGPRIASIMCGGGVLSYLVLIPMIKFFGQGMMQPLAPGSKLISAMSPSDIRKAYVLYIGAGAVAAGGIISLIRSFPTLLRGLRAGLSDFKSTQGNNEASVRTDRDLSMKFVAAGLVLLLVVISLARNLHMNPVGGLLIIAFGFLFVTVSSRLTGEIGASSNPVSGMTVATLLLTCLIFLMLRWTEGGYYVTALSVGAIVCIAAANGGATSQDLKTGFLIGATPQHQQIAILIGAFASALVLGPILLGLNNAATVYVPVEKIEPGLRTDPSKLTKTERLTGPQGRADQKTYRVWQRPDSGDGSAKRYLVDDRGVAIWLVDPGINGLFDTRPDGSTVRKFDAPKATLMSYIIKGIFDRKLPWAIVLFGVMIAIVLELCGVSSLAFAVGVYLPLSSSTPLFVGGFVRWLADVHFRRQFPGQAIDETQFAAESDKSPGVLLASGYIAGGAIAGIIIAFLAGAFDKADAFLTKWSQAHNPFFAGPHADAMSLIPFALLVGVLYLTALSQRRSARS